jgi:hypothetical protein
MEEILQKIGIKKDNTVFVCVDKLTIGQLNVWFSQFLERTKNEWSSQPIL